MPRFNHGYLLFNGMAGQESSEMALAKVVPILATHCKQLTIVQTMSVDEFQQAVISTENADVLFLMGGDGTLHTALQVLEKMNVVPVIGLLPGGTCNDFARTLEIPLTLEQAVDTLVNGEVTAMDVSQINDRWFMNFAGVGLIADASENINPDLKSKYGKLSYFMSAIQSFKQSEPMTFQLNIDGESYVEEAVMVLVMNGNSIGTHRFPLNMIDPTDGMLDVIVIQSSTMIAIREWYSLNQPNVVPDDLTNITHYRGQKISIKTSKPKKVDTDGEIYLETPIHIQMQPKKIKFLTP
jgi:YegS/Rv2252/BmrU family lipid kinase